MKIDTTKQPHIPENWSIEEHNTDLGKIDLSNISLWLHEKQKNDDIVGNELRKELPKGVLNATVLDYLLEHKELIPAEWKDRYVYFWGTVYRNSDGSLYVRYLCFSDGRWYWYYRWLGGGFGSSGPAAVLASSSLKSKKLEFDSLELRIKSLEEDMEKIRKFLVF